MLVWSVKYEVELNQVSQPEMVTLRWRRGERKLIFLMLPQEQGIVYQMARAYFPASDKAVECLNRTILDNTRARLLHLKSRISDCEWKRSAMHPYLRNQLVSKTFRLDCTPQIVAQSRPPNLSRLKIFASRGYVGKLENKKNGKFKARALDGILVRY